MSLTRSGPTARRTIAVLGVTAVALIAACGTGGPVVSDSLAPSAGLLAPSSGRNARTIAVSMNDTFRFDPERIDVTAGETVRFEVSNVGSIVHEFYVGDDAAQTEHGREMQSGGMAHDDPNGVRVDPGSTKAVEMTFAEAGDLLLGCHEPGHYAAGMRGTIHVSE